MSLIRCEYCGVKPKGQGNYKRNYVKYVLPVGHPHSAIICGRGTCEKPGVIWLEEEESKAYAQGERIFILQSGTTKVRAQ